jgi:hypothetical protein
VPSSGQTRLSRQQVKVHYAEHSNFHNIENCRSHYHHQKLRIPENIINIFCVCSTDVEFSYLSLSKQGSSGTWWAYALWIQRTSWMKMCPLIVKLCQRSSYSRVEFSFNVNFTLPPHRHGGKFKHISQPRDKK